jgi:phosphoglycolate phosphatase
VKEFDSVVFDLDGTLWDTCASCAVGWNNVLERHRISFRPITPEDIRRVTGMPHADCVRAVFSGLADKDLELLIHGTMEEDKKVISEMGGDLYPGVPEALRSLSQRYPLFIVSNCQAGYIETFLEWSGFGSLFKDFECWGNTGLGKGQNLAGLIKRNGLRYPVLVGDAKGDQEAARDCGIPFVFAEYGFGVCKDPDHSVGEFKGLLTLL